MKTSQKKVYGNETRVPPLREGKGNHGFAIKLDQNSLTVELKGELW